MKRLCFGTSVRKIVTTDIRTKTVPKI